MLPHLSPAGTANSGSLDPEFEKVPFAKWFSGEPQTSLRWSTRVLPVLLSVHQRLLTRIQVQLDGAEAARRRGEGSLIFYFQLTDSQGHVYQDHTTYDLEKVESGLRAQDLVCTESAFVLPGDYAVSLAIYNTATREHSVKRNKLHVAPLRSDPLPQAGRDLPAVEFIEASDPPDRWFLPKEHGRLHLPVDSSRPLHIEVLANLTPTQAAGRLYGLQDRNYGVLLPALKVISQLSGQQLSKNFSLLDLSRRKEVFHQEDVDELDWPAIKSSLSNAGSGSIDVKSLADRQHNAAFFVREVGKRLAAAKPKQALIILSGPMVFETAQDLSGTELQAAPGARVFYIRLQSIALARPRPGADMGRRSMGRLSNPSERSPNGELMGRLFIDQLEPTLKAIDPKVFDVASADQFRKALAAIIDELSGAPGAATAVPVPSPDWSSTSGRYRPAGSPLSSIP